MSTDNIAGIWDCVTTASFGTQESVLTIDRDGDAFTGSNVAEIGELPVIEGKIEGNRISWKMPTTKPMKMTLVGKAIVMGGKLEGVVVMGAFGKATMTGVKRA